MRRFEEVKENFIKFPKVKTQMPKRASRCSAGYDFYSKEDFILNPNESHMFWTDVCALMFMDNVLKIYPRSGNAVKHSIILKNLVGIIDSDYYNNEENGGNIAICLYNIGNEPFEIKKGDRIAQGIFEKYYIVDNDDMAYGVNSQKRFGGFGSTDIR